MKLLSLCIYPLFLMAVVACTTNDAPIVDGWKQASSETSDYRVQSGDTVYSIAWSFGMDYRELARFNQLQEPYHLNPGQSLHMSNTSSKVTPATPEPNVATPADQPIAAQSITHEAPVAEAAVNKPTTTEPATNKPPAGEAAINKPAADQPTTHESPAAKIVTTAPPAAQAANNKPATEATPKLASTKTTRAWLWPTRGPVIRGFSAAAGGNRGIDISGHLAQPVVATATGKVVYTGASLPGYGNLIIIKHTDNELSAYAFNKVIAVKEGQVIKAGQTIAQMGKNDTGKAILHFEVRKNGKPVDPLQYLPKNHK